MEIGEFPGEYEGVVSTELHGDKRREKIGIYICICIYIYIYLGKGVGRGFQTLKSLRVDALVAQQPLMDHSIYRDSTLETHSMHVYIPTTSFHYSEARCSTNSPTSTPSTSPKALSALLLQLQLICNIKMFVIVNKSVLSK